MFNSHIRLYDVRFQLTCLAPESPMFAVIAMLPEIENLQFQRIGITDTEWRKIEHVLTQCAVNVIHVEKTPHVEAPTEEEAPEDDSITIDDVDPEKRAGILLDEVMRRRELIYETADDVDLSDDKKAKEIELHARDFTASTTAFIDEIKKQILKELFKDDDED